MNLTSFRSRNRSFEKSAHHSFAHVGIVASAPQKATGPAHLGTCRTHEPTARAVPLTCQRGVPDESDKDTTCEVTIPKRRRCYAHSVSKPKVHGFSAL